MKLLANDFVNFVDCRVRALISFRNAGQRDKQSEALPMSILVVLTHEHN